MYLDLNSIVEEFNLDVDALSQILFSSNKFPRPALDRVLKGTAKLDSDQMLLLADYLSIPVQELYNFGGWKSYSKNDVLTLTRNAYVAKLNLVTFELSLSKEGDMIYNKIIVQKTITLSDFVKELDKYINLYINDYGSKN